MVKASMMLVAGVTFTAGLLLGIVLHLPGASSPESRPIKRSVTYENQLSLVHFEKDERDDYSSKIGAQSSFDVFTESDKDRFGEILLKNTLNMRRKRRRDYMKKIKSIQKENELSKNKINDTVINFSKHIYNSSLENVERNVLTQGYSLGNTPPQEKQISNNNAINIPSRLTSTYVIEEHSNGDNYDRNNNLQSNELEEVQITPIQEKDNKQNQKSNKLPVTLPPSVEMSVSIIDVSSTRKNHKPVKYFPSEAVSNDVLNSQNKNLDSSQLFGSSQDKKLQTKFKHLQEIVSDNIYWSPELEKLTPKGFSVDQFDRWRQHVKSAKVAELKEGCGRMQNRLVVFSDSSKMCARYRINTDQIQGEVYSYYLARLLGIDNVLPPYLTKVDPTSEQWKKVATEVDSAEWNTQKTFVLTPWIENLRPAYIPVEFQHTPTSILSKSSTHLVNKTLDELTELVQWSDLIILDYLTANVDRVVNNMFNLQWNSGMMTSPTHNLEQIGQSGPLVFLDNESGLLHSYRLLDKYHQYHEQLLRSLCVFRKSTVDKLISLYQSGDIIKKLKNSFQNSEPLSSQFPFIPQQNLSVLSQRLAQVYRQLVRCGRDYANS